jgi:hypothetical protein
VHPFPATPELLTIARHVIWFQEPELTLTEPVRFLVYLMSYGTAEDVRTVQKTVNDDQFREALDNAPPGILTKHQWNAWNEKLGRVPVPPMPVRRFPE